MNAELTESVKVWSQLIHPLLMWVLLAITVYALYSGIQIRRTRTADKDVRKELVKKDFRTKHYQLGSILLAFMVLGMIIGMAVTYANNGKLFVAPHLIAGLGMTGMIAVSAGLVPFMQKGSEFARVTHITLNIVLLALFIWQAFTGMEIVIRIISKL